MSATTFTAEAAAAALRHSKSVTDWIAAECFDAKAVDYHRQIDEATPEDFTGASVAWLMALAFDGGQHALVRVAALDAISEQFLASDVGAAVQRLEQDRVFKVTVQAEIDAREAEAARLEMFRRWMDYTPAAFPGVAA